MTVENETPKEEETIILNESNLSWAGKLFFTTMAAKAAHDTYMKLPFKIKGTPQQIKAIAETIYWSKAFQDELKKPGASVQSTYQKLQLGNMSKEKFFKLTGHKMPF